MFLNIFFSDGIIQDGQWDHTACGVLTDWAQVMHICISRLTIIASDNGLSPGQHQAIIWTNPGMLLNGPLGTNFSEILIKIYAFSLKKMHLKILYAKMAAILGQPQCVKRVVFYPWRQMFPCCLKLSVCFVSSLLRQSYGQFILLPSQSQQQHKNIPTALFYFALFCWYHIEG